MPDRREQLARNLHISSSPNSTCQAHTRHGSEEGREFSFWGSSNTIISTENDCDQLGVNEAMLKSEAEFAEIYRRKNLKFEEHSPFLPGSHHCCSVSDPSRIKAIEEGRRELMEKMQDMPESSYELSFQDMVVDEQQVQQPDQNETSLDNTLMQSTSSSNEAQIKKLNNKKKKKKNKSNNRPGQVSRVESMDSETFLLKIFFPTSLAFLKKVKVENGSKVSPRPSSLQESIKQVGKERIIKRFFQSGGNRGDAEDGISQNTSSSSDKSRHVVRSSSFSSRGCWPFFHYTKSKAKKLGG